MTSDVNQRAHWTEPLILIVGLVLCTIAVTFVILSLGSDSATDLLATLEQLEPWAEGLLFPLGMLTTMLCVGTLLRLWDLTSRRSRLRLLTIGLLLVSFLLELVVIDPLVGRLTAATTVNDLAVTSDVTWLHRLSLVRGLMFVFVALSLVAAHRAPLPVTEEVSAEGVTSRHRVLLFLVGTATLFEGYDRFIATLALPYIGKDLGADEGALGYALAFIRAGALVSILLARLADRHGRRRILLVSVIAYTLATAATGFSTGLIDFAIFQLVATIFLATELTLAQVVIAEEFPPKVRGFGQGLLGAFAALGSGLAAVLFPVLQRTELGWRGMYLIGVLPLLIVAYLRRNLPETQRWERIGEGQEQRFRDLWQPSWRTTLIVLTIIAGAASATAAPAFSFASYRATTALQLDPGQVSGMILGGGAIGFFGYFILGRLSDSVGRRWIGAVGILGGAVAIASYYQTTQLLPSFALLTLMESGVLISINALGTELFPTRLRATAKAWITNSATIGALLGLGAVGALSETVGGHSVVITALAVMLAMLAPLFFLLRETRRAELTEVGG